MITFAESHVDLMGSITFSATQLRKRWSQELGKKWSWEVQTLLRDFIEIKDSVDPATFASYDKNIALLGAFIADQTIIHTRRESDYQRNNLLVDTLAYESAVRHKAELELRINGRDAVAEVPEVTDPETGEVTQEFVAAVTAVEPLAETIETTDEDGSTVTITNPALTKALDDLAGAVAVITDASQETLDLVAQRVGS